MKRRDRREFGGLILKNARIGQFTFTRFIRGGDHSIDLEKVPIPEGFDEKAHPTGRQVEIATLGEQ